jgi:hypothetical protein
VRALDRIAGLLRSLQVLRKAMTPAELAKLAELRGAPANR